MPPKGWRKPQSDETQEPVETGVDEVQSVEAEPEPNPVPVARKPVSGLSSNLDAVARGRIGAVNDVTIMCRAGGKRFDFKAMWLKKFPAEIPVFDKTPQFVEAVRNAGEIWINCKTRRANNMEVTVDHSRHEALWLKEFV